MERTSNYVRPDNIPENMGGDGATLGARLAGVFDLMKKAPITSGQKVLDIGMGSGQLSTWLAQQGMQVTGTGLELESYCDVGALRSRGVEVVPCGAESMPFQDGTFDAVVMSHVLEHCPNVRLALKEVWRVLKEDGWLFVFVPDHALDVSAGHVSMGWSVGQLMYVLLTAGYGVKDGRFITWSGSVCGFVQKKSRLELPALRGDRGDLSILGKQGFFPRPIKTRDGFDDGFLGPMSALNWDTEHVQQLYAADRLNLRIARTAARFVPGRFRLPLAQLLNRVATVFCEVHNTNPPYLGN
jgi:SAM-dependent methyltransferase